MGRNGNVASGGLLGKGSFVFVVSVVAGVPGCDDSGEGGLSYSVTSGLVNFTRVCGLDVGLGISVPGETGVIGDCPLPVVLALTRVEIFGALSR